MSTPFAPDPVPERDNGLSAAAYQRLREVDHRECDLLLEAMSEAEIACYTAIPEQDGQSTRTVFVDATRQNQASDIADDVHRRFAGRRVTLDSTEVDARFADLIGSIDGPSNVPDPPTPPPVAMQPGATSDSAAPESASTSWRESDGDWLSESEDDEGYDPPPPAPLPKPTGRVVVGILLMIAGCVSIFSPSSMPVSSTTALVIGVLLLGAGTGWLVMQLRDRPDDDPFDDGSRV